MKMLFLNVKSIHKLNEAMLYRTESLDAVEYINVQHRTVSF